MVSYVKTRYSAGIWNIQKIKEAWLKYIHSGKPRDIITCIKQQDVTHIFKYIVNIFVHKREIVKYGMIKWD